MIPIKTITALVVGTALAGLAGWVGIASVSGVVAPQGDFSFLAEIRRDFSVASSSLLVNENSNSIYAASAFEVAPPVTVKKVVNVAVAKVEAVPTSSVVSASATMPMQLPDEIQKCTYATKLFPNYNRLIINEVAWMGTKADSSNEWVELKNTSEEPLELEGYQLIDKAEQIKITLPKATLSPGGLYLLERAEEGDQSLASDLLYAGALSNSNEGLRLFDRYCFLVDQIEATPKWPAGDAGGKKSMERGGGMNWYTFTGAAVNGVLGTPGKINIAPTSTTSQVIQPLVAVAEINPPSAPTDTGSSENPPPDPVIEVAVPGSIKILISKIQTTGGPGKTTEDFVEFYNPGPGEFNLKGYRLVKRTKTGTSDTSLKSWTADTVVAEGGVYRWANTTYPGAVDMRTSGSIADDNAVALRKGSEDTGEVIDAVGWGAAANALIESSAFPTNPAVSQILVRKNNQDTDNNSLDFEVQ